MKGRTDTTADKHKKDERGTVEKKTQINLCFALNPKGVKGGIRLPLGDGHYVD